MGKAMAEYCYIGMGRMGSAMAANLARKGLPVRVWNRTPDRPGVRTAREAGCRVADRIQEAVCGADFIFTCLADVPDVESVYFDPDGIAEFAKQDALAIDMSSIGPKAARSLAARLKGKRIRFLDAPVSGGDLGAKNGTLTIMTGGSETDFEKVREALSILGKNIHLCGSVGSGQSVKLINQVLCAVHMVGLSEAMRLAENLGVDPNLVVDICGTGAAGSWALTNLGPQIISGDFAPGFMVKLIRKDLRLIRETLEGGDTLPGMELADALFQLATQASEEGREGELGTQSMIQAYRKGSHRRLEIRREE